MLDFDIDKVCLFRIILEYNDIKPTQYEIVYGWVFKNCKKYIYISEISSIKITYKYDIVTHEKIMEHDLFDINTILQHDKFYYGNCIPYFKDIHYNNGIWDNMDEIFNLSKIYIRNSNLNTILSLVE